MGILGRIMTRESVRWWMVPAALFLALFVLPLYRYRPTCGDVDLRGPMRQTFLEYFEYSMKEFHFYYVKINNEIYMRYFNPWNTLANSADYMSYDDLISNSENKYAWIFLGPDAKNSYWDKLPKAKAARDDGLAWLREHGDDDPALHPNAVIVSRDGAVGCTEFYVLVIETESVPPDQLMRFLDRKPPQSPNKR